MIIKNYLIIFFTFLGFGLSAQTDTLPAYYIQDEQVILEFDIRSYEATKEVSFSKYLM